MSGLTLGDPAQTKLWQAKAVLSKNADWKDAMIDRYLRREIEAVLKERQ